MRSESFHAERLLLLLAADGGAHNKEHYSFRLIYSVALFIFAAAVFIRAFMHFWRGVRELLNAADAQSAVNIY